MSRYEFWKDDDSNSLNLFNQDSNSPDPFIKKSISLFNTLSEEEQAITLSLPNLISKPMSKQTQNDLLEAFALEVSIRNKEKAQILDSILDHDRQKASKIRDLENQINLLKGEIEVSKQIKNKRIKRVSGLLNAIDIYD